MFHMDGLFSMMAKLLRVTHLVKMTVDLMARDSHREVRLRVNQVQLAPTSFQEHHPTVHTMDIEG